MSEAKVPGAKTRETAMVHAALMREFGHLPELIRGVFEGALGRAAIVAEHIDLIARTVHEHHESEDLFIWPRLLERCPEEIAPLIHGMEDYHERIAELLRELMARVPSWRVDANAASRDAMLGILDVLLPVLRTHLREEVEYVLPLVEKHIADDEWNTMVAQGVAKVPQDKLPLLFGIVMYEGDPGPVSDALDKLPADVRPVMAETAPRFTGITPKPFTALARRRLGTR